MNDDIPEIRPVMEKQNPSKYVTLLRDSHPQLFKATALKSVVLFLIALSMFIKPEYVLQDLISTSRIIPLWFWGVVFTIISIMMAYGISNGYRRYQWARRALISGAIVTGMWGVGYAFALFGGETTKVFGTIFWFYVCGNFVIWTGEPAFNPLSSALHNGKETLQDDV